MNFLSTKCAERGSTQLLEFLMHDAIHYMDLVEPYVDGLLGALAILNEERTKFLFMSIDPAACIPPIG
jgi:hypothetical protein